MGLKQPMQRGMLAYNPGKECTTMTTATKPRSATAADKKPAKPQAFPKMTPWGREVLKRIEALHKAMDGKKLA